MAEALDPAAYIHEGFWTNWSKGTVMGRTLTLCPTYSILLTNSLALFVTLSGGQLWTILRFSLHQYRASRNPEAPHLVHRQEQVVLRNATTNFATLRLMSQVAWASRRTPGRPFLFCFLIVSLALVHAIFFMIAGAFSNNVANAGQEVLSRSKFCGVFNETYLNVAAGGINAASAETLQLSVEYARKIDHDIQLSHEYAQQCYASQPHNYMSSVCNTMSNSTISFDQSTVDSCPFQEDLCHTNSKTLVFSTGKIDSHRDLGINAKADDRLTYQRVTTCAVLNDTDRVTGWNGTRGLVTNSSTENIAYAYYGPSTWEATDWTYSYSDFASLFTNFTSEVEMPYQVSTQRAYAGSPDNSDFSAIPEVEQKSADLTLLFLSFIGGYAERIDDPWFSALHSHHVKSPDSLYQTQFERDRAISTVGCTEQHQFCTSNETCTGFLGVAQVAELQFDETNSFTASLNPHQAATFDRVLQAAEASVTAAIVASLALTNTPLLALSAVASGTHVLSLHLPDDQWREELSYWHSIAMAHLQRTVVEFGTGQIAPEPQFLIHPPPEEQDKWFCQNLMIRSTVYQSFSVLALGMIAGSGTLVILISLFIEDTAAWAQRRAWRGAAKRQSWDGDNMLRLHRASHRRGWGPEPPPKDANSTAQQDRKSPVEMNEIPHVHTVRRSPIFGIQSLNAFQKPQPLSPERIWLDLPPLPLRDSWIATSHRSFNFGFSHERDSNMRHLPPRTRYMRDPISVPSLQVPSPLQISDLREHAIARMKGPRF